MRPKPRGERGRAAGHIDLVLMLGECTSELCQQLLRDDQLECTLEPQDYQSARCSGPGRERRDEHLDVEDDFLTSAGGVASWSAAPQPTVAGPDPPASDSSTTDARAAQVPGHGAGNSR